MKKRVLFICVHNSARSQMAEAFCNKLGGEFFEAESAGLNPGSLNPYVVEAMLDSGIDISKNQCDSVFEFYKQGKRFSYVISVCSESESEKCPIFPGVVINGRLHWSFPDPSAFTGSSAEIKEKVNEIKDAILQKVTDFINQNK